MTIGNSASKLAFILTAAGIFSAVLGCSEKRPPNNGKLAPTAAESQSKNSLAPAGQDRDVDKSHVCPCCGYPTLATRGMYEICQLCLWEDDSTYDPSHPEKVVGGANGKYTLLKARTNFNKYLTMYDLDDERANESELSKKTKRELIRAYKALAKATPNERRDLQREIANGKQTLLDELKKQFK